MRDKDTIQKELEQLSVKVDVGPGTLYIVEVLLDIRELLINPPSHQDR